MGARQPTATLSAGPGCMAHLRDGRVMPCTKTGLSNGLPPNQGVSSLPHPKRPAPPAMAFIFVARRFRRSAGDFGEGARSSEVRRTKNPYSGARIGPFSRSAARKEKLPAFVHKVTM